MHQGPIQSKIYGQVLCKKKSVMVTTAGNETWEQWLGKKRERYYRRFKTIECIPPESTKRSNSSFALKICF